MSLAFLIRFDAIINRLSFEVRAVDTIDRIGGPLRLAKKYEMMTLYDRLVVILVKDWPTAHTQWMRVQESVDERLSGHRMNDQEYRSEVDCNKYYVDPGKSD